MARSAAYYLARGIPLGATLLLLVSGCGPVAHVPTGPDGRPSSPAASSVPSSGAAPTQAPAASANTTMSVPFGLYAASSYQTSIASMRMRNGGQYTMRANPYGTGIINPDEGGQAGVYEVLDAATIKFDTGAYAGLLGKLYPNYKGSARMFIDVQLSNGTKQSYSFVNP